MTEPAAYHEAGHVVAFLQYGCRIKLVAIHPTGAGVTRVLTHRQTPLTAFHRAVCLLAGAMSELFFTGTVDRSANHSDLTEAIELVGRTALEATGLAAAELVRQQHKSIALIAAELAFDRRLDEITVHRLMSRPR